MIRFGYVTAVALMLVLAGCGGQRTALEPATAQSGSLEKQLHAKLLDELARLGKDPSKITAAVAGSGNQVFDLTGEALDPDGPGGAPPNGVHLTWTDRLVGDYDNNGSVSISDITPLAANFGSPVSYRDPLQTGGIDWWPVGDPADDGGAAPDSPATAGSPAHNWMRARVDGDANSLINISDLTPLAAHLGERVDGYRIYRRGPGETDFSRLADPADPVSPLSASRLTLANGKFNRPLIYAFDDFFGLDGVYEYRVVPYCIKVDQEGPAGVSFWIDSRTGQPVVSGLRAILIADVTSGILPLAVNFDAGFSSGSIVKYEWDFDGDGTYDRNTGNVGQTDYIYLSNAVYNATVRVTDNLGGMAEDSLVMHVNAPGGNQAPIAAISATPAIGTVPLIVQFDSSGSTDLDGQILSHDWDFDGDGTFDLTTGTVATASHTYVNGGTYAARVRITDNDGGVSSAQVTVSALSAGGNQPPLASLTADKTNGTVPLTVQLNGAGSTDPDGTILLHEWDFDGDGIYDLNTGTLAETPHTFTVSAVYQVRLRVTDNGGSMAIASLQIDATGSAGGNEPPAVGLAAQPTSGIVSYSLVSGAVPNAVYENDGLAVSFTATAVDSDGTVEKYEWDFEGDGIFDFSSDASNTAVHAYKQAGTFQARVRVIDDDDSVGLSQAVPVTVNNTAALVQATYSPQPLDGQTAVESPVTVRLKADNSVDLDGSIVKYEWDLDNNGSYEVNSGTQSYLDKVFSTGQVQTHTFGVRLTDSSSATSTGSIQVPLKNDYDEVENNDTTTQATQFSITGNTQLTLHGNAGGAANKGYDSDDTDWYRVSLPGPRSLSATLNPQPASNDVNLDLRIYAGDGTTLLGSSLNSSGEDRIDNLVFLSAGTFFVKVSRFSSNGDSSFNYELKVTPSSVPWKELEALTVSDFTKNNDVSADAQQIQATDFGANDHLLDFYGRFSKDSVDVNNDSSPNNADWFKWNVSSGVDITIDLFFKHSDADLDLYLVNGAGQTIASSTSSTDNESIELATTAPGWTTGVWYVKVVRQTADKDCAYQLDVVGNGTETKFLLQGIAYDQIDIGERVDDGWQVVIDDLATTDSARDYVVAVDNVAGNSHNWEAELPNGQYKITLEDDTGSNQSYRLLLNGNPTSPEGDNLPAQIAWQGSVVTYEGDDASQAARVGNTLEQPIKIYNRTN